jgi:hypothetical protein
MIRYTFCSVTPEHGRQLCRAGRKALRVLGRVALQDRLTNLGQLELWRHQEKICPGALGSGQIFYCEKIQFKAPGSRRLSPAVEVKVKRVFGTRFHNRIYTVTMPKRNRFNVYMRYTGKKFSDPNKPDYVIPDPPSWMRPGVNYKLGEMVQVGQSQD